MTNILIAGASHNPSFDLTLNDFIQLSKVIPISVRPKLLRNITRKDISWCDILLCVRGDDYLHSIVAKKAVDAGRIVVLDLDDDLINFTPDVHPLINKIRKKSLEQTLRLSTCIVTASRYLGDKYKKTYGIRYVLIDTVVSTSEFREVEEVKGGVNILYAANPGHKVFFDTLITPILNDVYSKYNDRVTLTLIGPDVDVTKINMPVTKIPSMEMPLYNRYMEEHHFDIGLAPLFDNEFCKSKYFNKYLEYSKNNICGIYSDVIPYNLVVNNGETGVLVCNTPKDWFKAICSLIDDSSLRIRCCKQAREQISLSLSPENVAKRLVDSFPEIGTYKAKQYYFPFGFFMYCRFLLYESFCRILNLFK